MKNLFFLPAVAFPPAKSWRAGAKAGLFLFLLTPLLSHSQIPEYQRFMDAGKRELRAKNYDLAGKKFAAAGEFAFSQTEQKTARDARKDAERLRVQALENALREANRQKDLAEAEKQRAQKAEKKATAVLDKIYFYQDRYGLAYDKSTYRYGFIDKNLQTKIEYKYYEALPFDYLSYAKVKGIAETGYFQYYLIDTFGVEYPLATDVKQLDSTITALDLRQKGLVELPDSVLKFNQLKALLLSENQLAQLPPEIGNLSNSKTLLLSRNQLARLPLEIGNLNNLQTLDLSGNQLAQLPPEIGNLNNLQALNLSGNQLAQLPPEIGNLNNLQTLYLSGNQLAQLPLKIGNLNNLQTLCLSRNQFTQLPPEIGNLSNLQSLDLFENQLASLPPEIGNLTNLQSLDLSSNNFAQCSPEIGKLANLNSLNLGGNQLASLPPEIGKLANLQSLALLFNQLAHLPPDIGNLANLQRLDLRENQLVSLPPEIGKLSNLQRLDFRENQLAELPPEIGKLSNLQRLDLRENQLAELPPEIGKLSNLQRLDLRGNQLAELPPEIRKLTNLQVLKLSENPMSVQYIKKLRAEMSWCKIEWTAPEQEEEPPSSAALLEQNITERTNQEQIASTGELHLKANPTDTAFQKELASTYNSLAWRQLLTGQFSEAEASLARGFQLDSANIYLPTNLAPALLFQGKTEAAKQEYQKWKDLPFDQEGLPFYRDAFLSDLDEFEKAAIIPAERVKDVEAVREMLLGKKE